MINKTLTLTLLFSLFSASVYTNNLYVNLNGYHTPQGQLSQFSAFYINHGKIEATGTKLTLIKRYPNANIIDLMGKTVLPGLIDGHGHVAGLGFNLQRVSLRNSPSEQASVATVVKFAKENPNLEWIRGRGWNQVLWQNKSFPTKASLSEKISNRPVWLRRVDGHAGWANTKALTIAGINRNTVSPSGGEIVKDEHGEPTGILIDNAMDLLERHIPKNSVNDIKLAINQASKHLHKVGITSVHDAGIDYLTYQAYQELAQNNNMPLRIYAMINAGSSGYNKMLYAGKTITPDGMLKISSVKISADGALGSRGAAMLEPYSDDPSNSGLLLHSPAQLEKYMKRAIEHGFQVNVHAIGDKANHLALNYFEIFNQDSDSRALRHRIEHAQIVAVDDLPRFKKTGVLPSMQPTHATSDMNMAEDRVGHARIKGAYAWKSLLDSGVKIVSGSDFPVEYANPFYGLHAAVSRQDRHNTPKQGWLSHEAMTLPQALNSFTLDAAYGAHQEDIIGSLEPGKWADFIVIDLDIFANAPSQIWQANVLQTWIAGKRVYQK
mgnify:CR=1 FL=1